MMQKEMGREVNPLEIVMAMMYTEFPDPENADVETVAKWIIDKLRDMNENGEMISDEGMDMVRETLGRAENM
jgi:CBS domain containing-hemolysin-like protein